MAIIPSARAVYLCDKHVGYSNGKVDLDGIFTSIRAKKELPVRCRFCAFAQLSGGLGDMSFFFDIRLAKTDRLVYMTEPRKLTFASRTQLMQIAVTIEEIELTETGLYVVDLFCDNTWVCDTIFTLR